MPFQGTLSSSEYEEEASENGSLNKQSTLDRTTTVEGVSQYLQFHGIPMKFCSSIAGKK